VPFGYARAIVLDHTKVGSADLTDFPVGIIGTYASLATVANGGRVTSSSGFDIRPYADSGGATPLAFELVAYDSATGAVELWVKVPTLSHTVDTTIYLFYGNAGLTTDGSTSAWDSSFQAVYHLADNAATTTVKGSVGSNAVAQGNTSARSVAGAFGSALTFDGVADYLDLSSKFAAAGGEYTYSLWVKRDAGDNGFLFDFSDAGGNRWVLALGGGNWGGVSGGIGVARSPLFASENLSGPATVSTGVWTHLLITSSASGATMTGYLNAVAQTTLSAALSGAGGAPSIVGARDSHAAFFFKGALQEIRVSTVVRTPGWILAEYNNQSSPATFYSVGSETAAGGSPQTASPSPATSAWVALAAAVVLGAITAFPAPAIASTVAKPPTVTLGGVTANPAPAISTWAARSPAVALGGVTALPAPAISTWVARSASATSGSAPQTASPAPAVSAWVVEAPGVALGGLSRVPTPAVASWVVRDAMTFSGTVILATSPTSVSLAPSRTSVTLSNPRHTVALASSRTTVTLAPSRTTVTLD
jgi:hypothetical protein